MEIWPRTKEPDKVKQRPGGFEFGTGLLLPLGAILLAVLQEGTGRIVAFLIVGLGATLGVYIPTVRAMASLRAHARDAIASRRMFAALSRHIDNFGSFLSPHRSDALEGVLGDIASHNAASLAQFGSIAQMAFWEFWQRIEHRAKLRDKSTSGFLALYDEFNTLLANYYKISLEPVFNRLPGDVRNRLSRSDHVKLEKIRERLVAFRTTYLEFSSEVVASIKTRALSPMYLIYPEPLVGALVEEEHASGNARGTNA